MIVFFAVLCLLVLALKHSVVELLMVNLFVYPNTLLITDYIASAETVITSDEGVRGGKTIPLKQTVDDAVKDCPCVKRVLVATRTGADVHMEPNRDFNLDDLMKGESTDCPPEPMNSEDPLFMLYTSGSTGKPKGILHTQAGYLLYAGLTQQVYNIMLTNNLIFSLSTCLIVILVMCMHVLLILVGSLDTPMWYTDHYPMALPRYCLKALQYTLTQVYML